MAREKKPIEVDSAYDQKTGRKVGIMLDFGTGKFFAEIPNVARVDAATKAECKTKAQAMLAENRGLEWRPVIVLDCDRDTVFYAHEKWTEAQIVFRFRRCEIAAALSRTVGHERYVQRPHLLDIPEAEREPLDVGDPAFTSPNGGRRREQGRDISDFNESAEDALPYNDATWQALLRIHAALETAKKQLVALLADPVKLEIAGVGLAPLLGPAA